MILDVEVVFALFSLLCVCRAQQDAYLQILLPASSYPLPDLPYGYSDLEPFLDQATLNVHHSGHHRAYTNKMNGALEEWRKEDAHSELAQSSIFNILQHLSEVPDRWRTALRNNGGGYTNHIFYWVTMCHHSTDDGDNTPTGTFLEEIKTTFESFDKFKEEFSNAAAKLFGSGYVWLVQDNKGDMSVTTTGNQDCPLSDGQYPILVLDVWEHAYYLKHQNIRSQYIADWWSVVCWDQVTTLRAFWEKYLDSVRHEKSHDDL